jgi:hypothetical protein
MNTESGLTLVISLLIICVTLYHLRHRRFEREEHSERVNDSISARQLSRDMADKGYVQVPVPLQHFQETTADGDWENADTVTNDRKWTLAWVPADKLETVLATFHIEDENEIDDLLQAALRPT